MYVIAKKLFEFGHSVYVYTGDTEKKLRFPFHVEHLASFKSFEKGESGFKLFIKEIYDALKKHDFDIIFCSNFSSLSAISYLKGLVGGKVIFTFHCVPAKAQKKVIGYFNDWELEQTFAKNIIRHASPSFVVCPSRFFYEWALRFGVKEGDSCVINNSVDIIDFQKTISRDERASWRQKNNIPNDAYVFVTPARMLEKKGIWDLVQTVRKVEPRAFFLIVSSTEKANQIFKEKIDSYVNEKGLLDKVRIIYDSYNVTDMPRLYKMCDTFLLPSHFEGIPVSIIEAMASRIPVVCSDILPIKEIASNGFNCLTFKVRNIGDLARTINKAINLTPTERKQLVDNAYQTVVKRFDADKTVKSLEKLFIRITKK